MSFESVLPALAFALVAVWEALRPARQSTLPLGLRWFGNLTVFGFGWAILLLVPFLAGLGAAEFAHEKNWGLLNVISIPGWASLALGFVLLDLAGYWQHRLLHLAPFWRLHALHHSDPDLDVSTAIRHHPLEALMQGFLDALTAIAFGIPPAAVALYGGITFLVQIVHHGNVELPKALKGLRAAIVTPEFHRVHHSVAYDENNSNFSNLLTIWDRLFGTERRAPRGELRLGLEEFPGAGFQRLDKMMLLPLLIAGPPPRTPVKAPRV